MSTTTGWSVQEHAALEVLAGGEKPVAVVSNTDDMLLDLRER